jgi:hypothetical protein
MKNFTKFLGITILGLAFTSITFGQSATATATATILSPISITKNADLSFGNIIAGPGGTVTVSTADTRAGVGVTLPVATPGTVTSARFTVNGTGTSTYAITLPANHTITRVGFAETMTVDNFTSTPSGTGALVGGTQELVVGARLTVGAAQVPGTYTNAAGFTVTVNYK